MLQLVKNKLKLLHPGYQKLILDYPVQMKPRYDDKPHERLRSQIAANNEAYKVLLQKALDYTELLEINKVANDSDSTHEPYWLNQFLPGLDIVMLYTLLREKKPARYIEIGSGNSTKVARKAQRDGALPTTITSVDPFPRAQIDHISDQVIRMPLELCNVQELTESLQAGDFLFVDNSHRSFPNSDVTVFFTEILSELKPGVVVQLHDIYLPYDYPQFMCDRFYNEQYLLATALLANRRKYNILSPNYYISSMPELSCILDPFWSDERMKGVETHGGSFWFEINND